MRSIVALAVAGAAIALAGCATTPPRIDVERQWREAISNLGMFAIYPPSEDAMVGDAFLHVPNARYFDLVRITAAPRPLLARQLCYQEQDRLVLDASKDGASGVVVRPHTDCIERRPAARQRVASHDQATSADHATRLREAALPTLEVGRFSQGEIAGAGLLGNFAASLGIGFASSAAVRVELVNLQGLTLDELRGGRLIEAISIGRVERATDWAMLARNDRRRPDSEDFPNSLTPLMLARSLQLADNRSAGTLLPRFCRGEFDQLDRDGAQVLVANRLLFAGEVKFDFVSDSVAAMRAAVDVAAVLANRTQPTTTPPLPSAPQGAADARARGTGQDAIDNELARLMKIANGILTLEANTPGQVAGRLTVGRFGNITLSKPFTRPAAVGMGAALHFPLGDAAIPASEAQINDVAYYCAGLGHGDNPALRQRLQRNLDWARYLRDRDEGRPGAPTATASPRVPLRPVLPDPGVRVRM